jgi:hypothetical protein
VKEEEERKENKVRWKRGEKRGIVNLRRNRI